MGDPSVNLEEVKINETNDDTAVDMNEEFYTFFWVPKKMNKGKNFSKKDGKSKKQKVSHLLRSVPNFSPIKQK